MGQVVGLGAWCGFRCGRRVVLIVVFMVGWAGGSFVLRALLHRLSFDSALLSRGGEFGVTVGEDRFGAACEHVGGRDVAYRAVQTTVIVFIDEPCNQAKRIVETQRCAGANAITIGSFCDSVRVCRCFADNTDWCAHGSCRRGESTA